MESNLIDLRIHINCESPSKLKQLIMAHGSKFYPVACRSTICHLSNPNCSTCSIRTACQYYIVFSQELSNDPIAIKAHQKPPLPFAFSFTDKENGTGFDCRLVVFGNAVIALSLLITGFFEMIKQEPFCLSNPLNPTIYSTDCGGNEQQLKHLDDMSLNSNVSILSFDNICANIPSLNNCKICFKSPTRFFSNNKTVKLFSPSIFVRSAMRRVSSIAYYYSDYTFKYNFRDISRDSEKIRISNHDLSYHTGITGSVDLKGVPDNIMQFIKLSTYTNICKGATYGWGNLQLFFNK